MKSSKIKTYQNNWQSVKRTAKSKKENNTSGQILPTVSEVQHEFANLPSDAMMGNVQTANMEQPIQTKLQLGEVGDKYEQEADRIAKQVVNQIQSSTAAIDPPDNPSDNNPIQRQIFSHGTPVELDIQQQEPDLKIQQKIWRQVAPSNTLEGGTVSSDFEQNLNSAKSSGQPLNSNLKQQMGQAMGANFSRVKVHTDARADRLSRSIQARAFTTENNVFFKQGEYNPSSKSGQELIAHELTHVVQQNQGIDRSAIVQRLVIPSLSTFQNNWKKKVNEDKPRQLKTVCTKLKEWNEFKTSINKDKGYDYETVIKQEKGNDTLEKTLKKLTDLKTAIKNYKNRKFFGSKKKQQRQKSIDEILGKAVDETFTEIESLAKKKGYIIKYNPDLDWGILPKGTQVYKGFKSTRKEEPSLGSADKNLTEFNDVKVTYEGPLDIRDEPDSQYDKYCIIKEKNGKDKYVVEYDLINFKPLEAFEKQDPHTPLFPNGEVLVKHVIQGAFGDCYLQSALASIAKQNPNYIKKMVKDNDNGTVTVKLYEVDVKNENEHKFQAKSITVDKSIVKNVNENKYNKGALWVQVIQKAYAKSGLAGVSYQPKGKTPAPSFASIKGGFPGFVYEVLTGKPSTRFEIPTKIEESYKNFKGKTLPWDKNTFSQYNELKKKSAKDYSSLTMLVSIFKTNEKIDEWIKFVQEKKIEKTINEMLKNHIYFSSLRGMLKGEPGPGTSSKGGVTLSDIEFLFKGQSFQTQIMEWIKKQQIFPGELGTAIYSKTQLDLFNKVRDALNSGKPVSIASNHEIADSSKGEQNEGAGLSGGEPKFAGISGRHVYSIFACKTTESNKPEDKKTGKFHWLQVRNPWGEYSRKYLEENEKLKGITDTNSSVKGTFWLELSDVTKYFSLLGIGQIPDE